MLELVKSLGDVGIVQMYFAHKKDMNCGGPEGILL
jgi:hypothetical protein